ncbi:MAG: M20/M25/M40 family metallo-hydrolase [Steroidobacteraceae bacterium]
MRRDIHRHPELGYRERTHRRTDRRATALLGHRSPRAYRSHGGRRGPAGGSVVAFYRPARRHGCPADPGELGRCPRQRPRRRDARLRPRRPYGHAADGGALPAQTAASTVGSTHFPARRRRPGGRPRDDRGRTVQAPFPARRSTRCTTGLRCRLARLRRDQGPSWPPPTASRSRCVARWPRRAAAPDQRRDPLRGADRHGRHAVARRIPPSANAVLSVTRIQGGSSHNVLPAEVTLTGTVRTFDPAVQDRLAAALRELVDGTAKAAGCTATIEYLRHYPATVNDADCANHVLEASRALFGSATVPDAPAATSEDFAFMLREVPGAYVWLGQGSTTHTAPLHDPRYDFNDDVLATGAALLVSLAERRLATV